MSQEQTDDPVRAQGDRADGWWVMTFVIGMTALIVSIVAVIGAFGNDSGASDVVSPAGETEFAITLGEMSVSPKSIEVPAGQRITFNVTNTGTMSHDLKVLGSMGTDLLPPGESATVTVGPFGEDVQAWCTVPGHREAGMVLNITVLGATSSGDSGSHGAATDPVPPCPTRPRSTRRRSRPMTGTRAIHDSSHRHRAPSTRSRSRQRRRSSRSRPA